MVVEDLAAGSAGAGIAHHPEIVGLIAPALVADTHDAFGGHADLFGPDIEGLVIVLIDRDPEPLLGQTEAFGQQAPGERDRIALEVVAEAEVAQHLEKRVMPGRVADVFQIVVLATGPDAFLGRDRALIRPLVKAEKDILELIHPGIGEQQGGIVARHHGTGGHDGVLLGFEVAKESFADSGRFHE